MDKFFIALQDLLKKRRADGQTNQQISDVASTSHQHINRLLNGDPAQFGKVKLETLLRLFPSFFAPCLRPSFALTDDEARLVSNYRLADAGTRENVQLLAAASAAKAKERTSSAG